MTESIRSIIDARFGGVLRGGTHEPDGQACALEAASVARGVEWTDKPELVGLPDLRQLNDGLWSSNQARTEALVPMLDALWGWSDWSEERRRVWAETVALRTVREVLPIALRACHLDADATRCAQAETLEAAGEAAEAAGAAEAGEAAWAARAARASDEILQLACRIWIEAAKKVSS